MSSGIVSVVDMICMSYISLHCPFDSLTWGLFLLNASLALTFASMCSDCALGYRRPSGGQSRHSGIRPFSVQSSPRAHHEHIEVRSPYYPPTRTAPRRTLSSSVSQVSVQRSQIEKDEERRSYVQGKRLSCSVP